MRLGLEKMRTGADGGSRMSRDHEQYEENRGRLPAGRADRARAEVFEKHLATCAVCRQEFEQLRVASEALPRAVEPVAPPASLKKSLMEIVTAEARERDQAGAPRGAGRFRLSLPTADAGFAAARGRWSLGVAIGWSA